MSEWSGGGGGYGRQPLSMRVPVTPMVRRIMLVLTGVYFVEVLLYELRPGLLLSLLDLTVLDHSEVLGSGYVWTLVTYGTLHEFMPNPLLSVLAFAGAAWGVVLLYRSRLGRQEFVLFVVVAFALMLLMGALQVGGTFHVAGNLVVLYFFGHLFESRWGSRRFLWFFVMCTAGGGVLSTAVWYIAPNLAGPSVLGASAASMGLIAAFAVYYANESILYAFVMPIKGKYVLAVAILFDLVALADPNSTVAVFAHFGGMITALLLTTGYWRPKKLRGLISQKAAQKKAKRPHLRLVPPPAEAEEDDEDDPPRYLH